MARNPRTIFEATRVTKPTQSLPRLLNPLMEIWITADPFEIIVSQPQSVFVHSDAAPRNPDLDTVFNCANLGNDGVAIGILALTATLTGTWLNVSIVADPIELTISLDQDLSFAGTMFSTTSLLEISVTIGGGGTYSIPVIVTSPARSNWVKWSNIGNLNFTIWKDNVSGERPIDWKGWIYAIKKLGTKVVVYGQNGVSFLVPSGVNWGLQTVIPLGLKGRNAVCGDGTVHYFIDSEGTLYKLSDSLEILDYSEYLASLGAGTILSLDPISGFVYICDGTLGFVYSPRDKSLGSGPVNITGIGSQGGISYVASSAAIVNPIFEICTDIYDLGTRKNKTIHSIEIGTDLTGDLWATIDYRLSKAASFATQAWHIVNPNGIVVIPCFGVEFRFKVKRITYAALALDYIKVNGVIHNYSYLDTLSGGKG